ncbi:MAG TPA: hypothetical protein VK469_10850 [Candidatus Kapabacteria bacterium]|nr:hypothetical protein [Candidatus Kapabacteria bacterium]
MDLFLQMGFGMKEHSLKLIKEWNGGTILLSPRDMTLKQMEILSKDIKKEGGNVLIDPQFYLPRADHDKLIVHSFWPHEYETKSFFSKSGIKDMLKTLWNDYNMKLGASFFILPGTFSSIIDDDWKSLNDLVVETSLEISISVPLYATLCLSSDVLRSEDQIHEILEHVGSWNVAGFYVVAQHPKGQYMVEDALWVTNLLDLCAGLKIINKKVIVGYSNHQQFCLAAAKVDAIASGTWRNVRMFPLEKFNNPEEDAVSRRTTWYYCPQALSEYQITFLDIAQKAGILDRLKTNSSFQSNYADILFEGAQPTSVNFQEKNAFRHYLQCLKIQSKYSSRSSFKETINGLLMQLEATNQLLKDFRSKGVRGGYRDFFEVIDINISALDMFKNIRGFILDKKWNSI